MEQLYRDPSGVWWIIRLKDPLRGGSTRKSHVHACHGDGLMRPVGQATLLGGPPDRDGGFKFNFNADD